MNARALLDALLDDFEQWFAGSKVVDAKGEPLRVYHGTNAERFAQFDLGKAGSNNDPGMWGTGFYFSPRRAMSRAYGKNVGAYYLCLKNPLIVRRASGLPEEFRPVGGADGASAEKSASLRQRLLAAGYDGVMHYETGDKPLLSQVVAFHPEQIRAAK